MMHGQKNIKLLQAL